MFPGQKKTMETRLLERCGRLGVSRAGRLLAGARRLILKSLMIYHRLDTVRTSNGVYKERF